MNRPLSVQKRDYRKSSLSCLQPAKERHGFGEFNSVTTQHGTGSYGSVEGSISADCGDGTRSPRSHGLGASAGAGDFRRRMRNDLDGFQERVVSDSEAELMARTLRERWILLAALLAIFSAIACDDPLTPITPVVRVPLHDVTVICPGSHPGPNCTVCEIYNQFGTCAESECAENGGWIGNPYCDPFDCAQGYWWCEYAPPVSSKDSVVPVFVAECDVGVVRGQVGTCTVRSEASSDFADFQFTVNSQSAQSADPALVFEETQGVGETYQGGLNGDSHIWSGKFIAKTAVRFQITSLGKQYSPVATFEPVRRSTWTAWIPSAPQENYQTHPVQLLDIAIRPGVTVGLFGFNDVQAFSSLQVADGGLDGGPNASLWYATALPQLSTQVYIHPRLANSGSFFLLQDGLNGHCSSLDATAFRDRVRRHEGSTLDNQSHWAILREALEGTWRYPSAPSLPNDSLPHNSVERRVIWAQANGENALRNETWTYDWIPFRDVLPPQNALFDAADSPIVNSWGACTVVWEP